MFLMTNLIFISLNAAGINEASYIRLVMPATLYVRFDKNPFLHYMTLCCIMIKIVKIF